MKDAFMGYSEKIFEQDNEGFLKNPSVDAPGY